MQPEYKHPTKGNLHQLTIRQHIHSKHLIKKFKNPITQKIGIYHLESHTESFIKSNNALFCTFRTWDETTEKVFCNQIEKEYFAVVNRLLSSKQILKPDHKTISKYYCLWNIRHCLSNNSFEDWKIHDYGKTTLAYNPTQLQQEELEKNNITPIHSGGIIDRHFRNGLKLRQRVDKNALSMKNIKWSLLEAPSRVEFICANVYPNILFMPISPKLALIEERRGMSLASHSVLTFDEVANLNLVSKINATKHYIYSETSLCPIRKKISHFLFPNLPF